MTSSEFLVAFQQHLQVGDPKRSDIIGETTTHLNEQVNLGNPKLQAKEFNKVYFGRFGTFEWLLLRTFLLPLVNWVLQDVLTAQIIAHGRTNWVYILLTMGFLIHLLSLANILTSAHTLAHMHRRWYRAGWWSLVVLATAALQIGIGFIKFPPIDMTFVEELRMYTNYVWYLALGSLIFIPAFFVTWPTVPTSWVKKIGFALLIAGITYGIYFTATYTSYGVFTYLYSYPWVKATFPSGFHGWDIALIVAIVAAFFLHEIRFTARFRRKKILR